MVITDKRINTLIKQFYSTLTKNRLDDMLEYIEYPGGIVWVTEKQLKLSQDKLNHAAAYIKKIQEHGATAGQIDIPLFKIILVKERVLHLNNKEFLHLLAHEVSHILFQARKIPLEEYACDVLADHLFGYAKPNGSTLGYFHDKEAFEKIYGKRPPK